MSIPPGLPFSFEVDRPYLFLSASIQSAECGLVLEIELNRAGVALKELLDEWERWRSEWAKTVTM